MINYALDTNIVSYILRKDEKLIQRLNEERTNGNSITIPPLVYFEIKRWLVSNKAAAKLRIFENLYQNTGISVIDKEILEIAVSVYVTLRSKGTAVDDADILIAAFCIKHGLTLVTNNLKHFEDIEELPSANWPSKFST